MQIQRFLIQKIEYIVREAFENGAVKLTVKHKENGTVHANWVLRKPNQIWLNNTGSVELDYGDPANNVTYYKGDGVTDADVLEFIEFVAKRVL